MNKIIKVTLIETIFSEKGAEKVQNYFVDQSSDSFGEEVDWESMGVYKSEGSTEDSIILTEDDYETTEVEATILSKNIIYYYKTPRKETTTIKLKTGVTLTIKEDVKYLDKNLYSSLFFRIFA